MEAAANDESMASWPHSSTYCIEIHVWWKIHVCSAGFLLYTNKVERGGRSENFSFVEEITKINSIKRGLTVPVGQQGVDSGVGA